MWSSARCSCSTSASSTGPSPASTGTSRTRSGAAQCAGATALSTTVPTSTARNMTRPPASVPMETSEYRHYFFSCLCFPGPDWDLRVISNFLPDPDPGNMIRSFRPGSGLFPISDPRSRDKKH